ncbi:MAG: DUF559 domain-containing protein [Alloprevotella sp.]
MKILVTGAKGFVGRNLCAQLKNIRDGKARFYGFMTKEEYLKLETTPKASLKPDTLHYVENVFEYDLGSTQEELETYCSQCDFVFNLAGVNRPQNQEEFMQGNFGFASTLLDTLKKYGNKCPVMLSSSIQATLAGRFGTSEYGKSKKAGEQLFFDYAQETGAKVLVYRFPNLFGKWCRPNYNSAIATFCHNIAHDLPIQVNDRSVEMELLYIDDLVDELINTVASSNLPLKGEASEYPHRCEYDGMNIIRQPLRGEKARAYHGVQTSDPTRYKLLQNKAEELRKYSTDAESLLWEYLRNNSLGVKFRRQHVIGNYIADFLCVEKKLVIEVDGGYHNSSVQKEKDAFRSQFLYEHGYTEMRFSNEEVLLNIDNVISRIQHILQSPLLQEGQGEATYCFVPITHKTTLGEIVDIIQECADAASNKNGINMMEMPPGSLRYKLMTTYLSYLPREKAIYDFKMNTDPRGSFTELCHSLHCGQVSINISKPGVTKGEHWHHSKWETFIVVSGHGLIRLRKEDTDEIWDYEVSGDHIQAVQMLPGYTHNIINLSDTDDLVTVMYCNEIFNPNRPDTYFDPVESH